MNLKTEQWSGKSCLHLHLKPHRREVDSSESNLTVTRLKIIIIAIAVILSLGRHLGKPQVPVKMRMEFLICRLWAANTKGVSHKIEKCFLFVF